MKSTMRKVIGIMPLYDDEKESYWMPARIYENAGGGKCDSYDAPSYSK